jgi:CheY-like chemotaxis protein
MRTAHPAPAGQEPEVLLVEDNLVSQKIASAFLRNSGYVTRIAGNGAEALERLHADRGRFVAVLMDCQMPVMDGYALTRALRQEEREHPELRRLRIIAMTANAMEGDRERCLEAGMDDYIAKPVDPDRLVALLEAMG